MEFLKKHYEKILLSLVLLGLAVAAAWLPIKVSAVRQTLEEASTQLLTPKPKPLPALDTNGFEQVLLRVDNPGSSPLGKPGHNVFNPIKWLKKPDGTPVPALDTGLSALSVTNITPLYLRIDYQGPQAFRETSGEIRYSFQITREAASRGSTRGPILRMATVGGKNEIFTLRELKGPKENPTALVLELNETKETVTVSKEKPYTQVAGYAADLRYEPENKTYAKQRVGEHLTLAGERYNIVYINQSDVTLEDNRTRKRTTIHWAGAP